MRISWDGVADRAYSAGISQGVLYPGIVPGVAWNGLISVAESDDKDQQTRYIDGKAYRVDGVPQSYSGTISAFTYPDELEPFISTVYGSQTRDLDGLFGISWRTNREIHLVYNVILGRKTKEYSTFSPDINPVLLEWDFTTLPEKIPGGKPSSHLVIMTGESDADAISDLEALIYGNDENDPVLPEVADILEIFESRTTLRITDNGDGTWSATGPDTVITMLDADTFQIDWPSAVFISDTDYRIKSL